MTNPGAALHSDDRLAILSAGGTGTRLYPLATTVNKHLLPIYDKPMIYYPLTTLMLAGLRNILLISTPKALPEFERCLGDGSQWGLSISYVAQPKPEGVAQSLHLAEPYAAGRGVVLMLGDNILYGANLPQLLRQAAETREGATIFAYVVADPREFGVVTLDSSGLPVALTEKPRTHVSNWAVPGLYFYDREVFDIARDLPPSARGELEISDVNRRYLERGSLRVVPFGRGIAWLDGGTCEDLFAAGQFVQVMEARTGLKIASPEEVAFNMGYISLDQLDALAARAVSNSYGTYLREVVARQRRDGLRPGSDTARAGK